MNMFFGFNLDGELIKKMQEMEKAEGERRVMTRSEEILYARNEEDLNREVVNFLRSFIVRDDDKIQENRPQDGSGWHHYLINGKYFVSISNKHQGKNGGVFREIAYFIK